MNKENRGKRRLIKKEKNEISKERNKKGIQHLLQNCDPELIK